MCVDVIDDDQPSLCWFRDHLKSIVEKHPNKCYLALQQAGECILLPVGWWHAVFNCEDVVGLTENHVSLETFVKELQSSIDVDTAEIDNCSEDEKEKQEKEGIDDIIERVEEQFGLVDFVSAQKWFKDVTTLALDRDWSAKLDMFLH